MIFDISISISNGMVSYPGDPVPQLEDYRSIAKGDTCGIKVLHLGSHTGTHVDAPAHFVSDGKTIDKVDLQAFGGHCQVIEIPGDSVTVADLADVDFTQTKRLLFKTKNSAFWAGEGKFHPDFCYISPAAAKFLVGKVLLVGIDYLSVEQYHSGHHLTHLTLLGNNIVALEGLDLSAIAPGSYTLAAFPLKISGGDGSPVRAVLIRD